jgi:hypothetical protein
MLAEWTLGTTLWTLLALFFWSMFLWLFITVFADIFRRRDLSGFGKAAWIFLIVILPFIGILIYLIARPSAEVVPPDGMMGVA